MRLNLYLLYLFHDTLSTADATFRPVSGMTKGAGTDSLLLKLLLYRRNGSIRWTIWLRLKVVCHWGGVKWNTGKFVAVKVRARNSTYLLTPWCRVLLERLTGLQLVKKFPAFHRTWRFITALTSFRHLSLSWASPIQSIYPHHNIYLLTYLVSYLLHGAESFLWS